MIVDSISAINCVSITIYRWMQCLLIYVDRPTIVPRTQATYTSWYYNIKSLIRYDISVDDTTDMTVPCVAVLLYSIDRYWPDRWGANCMHAFVCLPSWLETLTRTRNDPYIVIMLRNVSQLISIKRDTTRTRRSGSAIHFVNKLITYQQCNPWPHAKHGVESWVIWVIKVTWIGE